ncbi:MAG: c-type cytochrome [Nitrosomonadales bacterium]|nr:c-type cytochrome [Nitrosomonadales bacterium]
MTALTGCQPDTPAKQAEQPAAAPAVAAPVPVAAEPSAQVAAPVSKELQLAQASKCFACHAIDKKLVGPGWKEVATKYRGQKGAEAKLIDKVAKGGSGAWGAVPMPPNAPQVAQNDIKTLVRYILGLK